MDDGWPGVGILCVSETFDQKVKWLAKADTRRTSFVHDHDQIVSLRHEDLKKPCVGAKKISRSSEVAQPIGVQVYYGWEVSNPT